MHFRSTGERDAFAQSLRAAILRADGADHDVLARLRYRDWVRNRAIAEHKAAEAQIARLRAYLRDVQLYLQYRRKYRPDQPRVPAGNPDGGQWTYDGGPSRDGRREEARRERQEQERQQPDSRDRTPSLSRDVENSFLRPEANPSLDRMPWRDSFGEAPDGTPIEEAGGRRPSSLPVDLKEEEGDHRAHTIRDHVNKSNASLAEKLRSSVQEEVISGRPARTFDLAAGSFSSIEAANKLVNSTLSANAGLVLHVAQGDIRGFTVLEKTFSSTTGYEACWTSPRQEPRYRETNAIRVVIVHDSTLTRGFRIHTAFPITKWRY